MSGQGNYDEVSGQGNYDELRGQGNYDELSGQVNDYPTMRSEVTAFWDVIHSPSRKETQNVYKTISPLIQARYIYVGLPL